MKYRVSETIYSSKLYEVLAISPAIAKVIVQSSKPLSTDSGTDLPRKPSVKTNDVNEKPERVSALL
jgi:SH3-like domain-containing protein